MSLPGRLDERHELFGDPHHALLPALRERPGVGAAHEEEPAGEIDVVQLEAAELALAESREDGGGEDRAMVRDERGEERQDLFGREDARDPLGDLARVGLLGRVGAEPLLRLARLIEGAHQEAADVIHRLRGESAILLAQQRLDVSGPDVLEPLAGDLRRQDVIPNGADVALV